MIRNLRCASPPAPDRLFYVITAEVNSACAKDKIAKHCGIFTITDKCPFLKNPFENKPTMTVTHADTHSFKCNAMNNATICFN